MGLLASKPIDIPKDGDGKILHEQDRVFGYDYTDLGHQRIYGTLMKSEEPETYGHWCVEWDDGECFMVIDFDYLWKAE